MIIPASDPMPGAADAEIFSRALEAMRAHDAIVAQALTVLDDLAEDKHSDAFSALDDADRTNLVDELKTLQPAFIQVLQTQVVMSYYTDERVLLALGMPAGPPHPGGYSVEATDWSLLDPVRKRKPFYRHV